MASVESIIVKNRLYDIIIIVTIIIKKIKIKIIIIIGRRTLTATVEPSRRNLATCTWPECSREWYSSIAA